MTLRVRRLLPLVLGALCLVLAVASFGLGQVVVGAALSAAFAVMLLGLVVHTHTRAGSNYRQLRSDHEKLVRLLETTRRSEQELLDLAEQMTPIITRTVARDWSVNASRIAARYDVLEHEVRALFGELEERSGRIEAESRNLVTAATGLKDDISTETSRLRRGLANLPTTPTTRRLVHEAVSEMDALLQLRERFGVDGGAPLLDGWALSPRAMLHTLDLVDRDGCEVVLECGSGASTVYIAHVLRRRGRGRVISLEHDRDFLAATGDQVTELGLDPFVDLRYSPLVDVEVRGTTFAWYGRAALDGVDEVDVLLVDGPPTSTGRLARYPALPQLFARLSPDAVVLVDDASRTDEKEMIVRWREEYGLVRGPSPTNELAVLRRGDAGTAQPE